MIYDLSYFTNHLFIPNINNSDRDVVSNNHEVEDIMMSADVKFLNDCFGFTFSKQIFENIDSDGTVKSGAPQIIKNLVDGEDALNWLGLRFEINGIKKSMMANFAFCEYLSQTNTKLTQVGNVTDATKKQSRF